MKKILLYALIVASTLVVVSGCGEPAPEVVDVNTQQGGDTNIDRGRGGAAPTPTKGVTD